MLSISGEKNIKKYKCIKCINGEPRVTNGEPQVNNRESKEKRRAKGNKQTATGGKWGDKG